MQDIFLSIGGLVFRFSAVKDVNVDAEFTPFLCTGEDPDVCITFRPDSSADKCETEISAGGNEVQVRYHPSIDRHFAGLRGCLIHTPVEAILLLHDRFFLHASFIDSPYGGLLFTGDSGVGKSTQAELWRKHRDSKIINGDRAIVAKAADGWSAWGSPYAGSSGYYVQADAPVRAVILPEQAGENRVDAVTPSEAFRKLFLQVSLDHSSSEQVNHLCDLLTELTASMSIYRLRCTPDVRAVQVLEDALRKGMP